MCGFAAAEGQASATPVVARAESTKCFVLGATISVVGIISSSGGFTCDPERLGSESEMVCLVLCAEGM